MQESRGAAFYRGADSVCLCFSIIDRKSLQHVADWFAEFKARCPVDQGREGDMTWICIANKLDLKSSVTGQEAVSEEEAQALLDELLPPTIAEDDDEEEDGVETPKASSHIQQQLHFLPPVAKPPHYPSHDAFEEGERRPRANNNLDQLPSVKAAVEDEDDSQLASQPTASIDILTPTDFYRRKHSNSQSARKLSTTASSHSVYHTPSASWDPNLRTSSPPLPLNDVDPDFDDAVTPLANPSSFINGNLSSSHQKTKSEKQNLQIPEPKPPSRGIKLFLTSAKTGQNLDQLFEYCAQHIYDRLRYKEYQKQLLNGMDGQSDEFDLANVIGTSKNGPLKVGPPAGLCHFFLVASVVRLILFGC